MTDNVGVSFLQVHMCLHFCQPSVAIKFPCNIPYMVLPIFLLTITHDIQWNVTLKIVKSVALSTTQLQLLSTSSVSLTYWMANLTCHFYLGQHGRLHSRTAPHSEGPVLTRPKGPGQTAKTPPLNLLSVTSELLPCHPMVYLL